MISISPDLSITAQSVSAKVKQLQVTLTGVTTEVQLEKCDQLIADAEEDLRSLRRSLWRLKVQKPFMELAR